MSVTWTVNHVKSIFAIFAMYNCDDARISLDHAEPNACRHERLAMDDFVSGRRRQSLWWIGLLRHEKTEGHGPNRVVGLLDAH